MNYYNFFCVCVCVRVCAAPCVHTCVYAGQRSTLGTALQEPSMFFWEPGSLTVLTLANTVSWVASEPQRAAGLCVPSSVTTSAHQTAAFVMWVPGSTLGPHSCKATILLSELSPKPFVTVLFLTLRVMLREEHLAHKCLLDKQSKVTQIHSLSKPKTVCLFVCWLLGRLVFMRQGFLV